MPHSALRTPARTGGNASRTCGSQPQFSHHAPSPRGGGCIPAVFEGNGALHRNAPAECVPVPWRGTKCPIAPGSHPTPTHLVGRDNKRRDTKGGRTHVSGTDPARVSHDARECTCCAPAHRHSGVHAPLKYTCVLLNLNSLYVSTVRLLVLEQSSR